ncbi:probable glycosyltransferase WbpH [Janibacter sp. HTCC2649]|uniref:glycosyltransferase n=1 Tax=Janibacter sp. HTCC2649 TaxID=313589 RepID=UPI0000671039|nr:glycosyltransferase [Janibacter sp. HTCC2649]EAP97493.1 probable glycosyltransferase WbpH [Janibacter sp. HTCC2649]
MPVDVSFVTSGHDVADARLHRLAAAARRAGLTIEVLGLGSASDAPRADFVTATPRGSFARRALLAVRYALRARGRVLVALDPDSLLACLAVSRPRGRRVVADIHEDYEALLSDRAWARGFKGAIAARLARAATEAARHADLVLVADAHIPPHDVADRLVVRNVPDLAMMPEPSELDDVPRAIYIGDVRRSRGLQAMLDAVEGSPSWHLDVVGPVAAADAPDVTEAELERRGLAHRVRFHGRQPPEKAWRLADGAWCGLALLEDTPAFRDAVPSKLYEYLGSGLAVVVTNLPRQRQLVEHIGAGAVVAADARAGAECAKVLAGWALDEADIERHRSQARRWREVALETGGYDEAVRALGALAGRPEIS